MNNAPQNWNCPPLMNDGRQPGTDFRPTCDAHNLIIQQNNLPNSYEYRQFMINNAKTLMDLNTQYYIAMNQCQSCRFFQPDPNGNDQYWDCFTKSIGYQR